MAAKRRTARPLHRPTQSNGEQTSTEQNRPLMRNGSKISPSSTSHQHQRHSHSASPSGSDDLRPKLLLDGRCPKAFWKAGNNAFVHIFTVRVYVFNAFVVWPQGYDVMEWYGCN